jgi:hypothetical protein
MDYVSRHKPAAYIGTQITQFPKICREEASIHLIQSREHILNTVCYFCEAMVTLYIMCYSILNKYRITQR